MFLTRPLNLNVWTVKLPSPAPALPWTRAVPTWIDGVACCRECGEPIPQKRLEALPGVGLCRACQEERESGR